MIWPFSTIAALRAKVTALDGYGQEKVREIQEANAAKMELARQLAEACKERDQATAKAQELGDEVLQYFSALSRIEGEGAASRNGTARKLARMAREALE